MGCMYVCMDTCGTPPPHQSTILWLGEHKYPGAASAALAAALTAAPPPAAAADWSGGPATVEVSLN